MAMEKTGVVDGEGEEPNTKQAAPKCPDCGFAHGGRGGASQPKSMGNDLQSKMAEATTKSMKKG